MRPFIRTLALLAAFALAGCSVPAPGGAPDGIHDPYEDRNRRVHAFNTGLDGGVVSRAATLYVREVPEDLRQPVSNLASHLSLPRSVVNQVLQGRLIRAGRNTLRFATNTVLGFGGLFDVAQDFGMPIDDTDFGETLYVWGVPEGAYQELPFIGPSTERRTAGRIVDLVLNPLDPRLTDPQRAAKLAVRGAALLDERASLGGAVDDVLGGSADSYGQVRLIYLQNRRFDLGDTTTGAVPDADPLALDTEGF